MTITTFITRNGLKTCQHSISRRHLMTSLVKEINSENAEQRKAVMFNKLVDQKRDLLNYLTVELSFQFHDTTFHLRSWNDQDMFHVTTSDYFGFKKNMGHIPIDAEATERGKMDLAAEMVTWALRFLKKQNCQHIVLMTKGYTEARNRCMQIVWDEMKVVHYLDLTRICFKYGDRRRKPRRLKRHFRPKSVYPMGYF